MEHQLPWRFLTIEDVRQLDTSLHLPKKKNQKREAFFKALSKAGENIQQELCLKAEKLLEQRKEMKEKERLKKVMSVQQGRQDRIEANRAERTAKLSYVPPLHDFLEDIGIDRRKDLLGDFIEATSMKNVCQAICCCCAGTFEKCTLQSKDLLTLPNPSILSPAHAHPAHELTHGMLLQKHGLKEDEEMTGLFCNPCWNDVSKSKVPKLALANDMWVGDIPFELQVLTVPERLLISVYYPVVYVYKLYPKNIGKGHTNILHEKMRGNVSTYRLSPHHMASLASGRLLPRRPDVLASLISVTLVGRNKVPEKTLRGIFQLRRSRILAALQWLKTNNPFYHNIEIDEVAVLRLHIAYKDIQSK